MILAEKVYKIVTSALKANSITAYSDYVPDEVPYDFIMYEIISQVPFTGFHQDYETLTVRFHCYSDKVNPYQAVNSLQEIETIFNRIKHVFVDAGVGYLICCYKVDDAIGFDNGTWDVTSDYEFVAQRDL